MFITATRWEPGGNRRCLDRTEQEDSGLEAAGWEEITPVRDRADSVSARSAEQKFPTREEFPVTK